LVHSLHKSGNFGCDQPAGGGERRVWTTAVLCLVNQAAASPFVADNVDLSPRELIVRSCAVSGSAAVDGRYEFTGRSTSSSRRKLPRCAPLPTPRVICV